MKKFIIMGLIALSTTPASADCYSEWVFGKKVFANTTKEIIIHDEIINDLGLREKRTHIIPEGERILISRDFRSTCDSCEGIAFGYDQLNITRQDADEKLLYLASDMLGDMRKFCEFNVAVIRDSKNVYNFLDIEFASKEPANIRFGKLQLQPGQLVITEKDIRTENSARVKTINGLMISEVLLSKGTILSYKKRGCSNRNPVDSIEETFTGTDSKGNPIDVCISTGLKYFNYPITDASELFSTLIQ